jgi:hypothetical protein
MGETRNVYRILVGNVEGKRLLRRSRIPLTWIVWLRIWTSGGLL